MGLFSRKPKIRTVSVSFRELTSDRPPDADHAYVYTWSLPDSPRVGERVWVRGSDGRPAAAVVAAVDVPSPRGIELSPVLRAATADEINAARTAATAAEAAWLDMARRAAGLPVTGSRRSKAPDGYPQIAPVDGRASEADADTYGRMWWRVYKTAQSLDWPRDEVRRIEAIARRWYAVRDKGGN